MVRLPEGVQLMALISVDDERLLEIDMPLIAKPRPFHGEGFVLGFVPAVDDSASALRATRR